MRNAVAFELGVTRLPLWKRVHIAFRLIFKKQCVFNCAENNIYHYNRGTPVTEIEL